MRCGDPRLCELRVRANSEAQSGPTLNSRTRRGISMCSTLGLKGFPPRPTSVQPCTLLYRPTSSPRLQTSAPWPSKTSPRCFVQMITLKLLSWTLSALDPARKSIKKLDRKSGHQKGSSLTRSTTKTSREFLGFPVKSRERNKNPTQNIIPTVKRWKILPGLGGATLPHSLHSFDKGSSVDRAHKTELPACSFAMTMSICQDDKEQ